MSTVRMIAIVMDDNCDLLRQLYIVRAGRPKIQLWTSGGMLLLRNCPDEHDGLWTGLTFHAWRLSTVMTKKSQVVLFRV